MAISDGMRFQYGNYIHPYNEVRLEKFEMIPRYSNRGLRRSHVARITITGELQYTGQAALTAAITTLRDAYADDGKDAGLLQGDGVRTTHFLETDGQFNLTPVRVVHRSWPSGDGDEYANKRTFMVVLEAEYRDEVSDILLFEETLAFISTGGPEWQTVRLAQGLPRRQDINQATEQTMIQSGRAVGGLVYPFAALPGPLFPNNERQSQRRLNLESPQFMGQDFNGRGMSWVYVHEFTQPQTALPNQL